jgi:hypothetical protein
MTEQIILPWAALASIAAAIMQAGTLLQRLRAADKRISELEQQVRQLELWQQRQRGRQDAARATPPESPAWPSSHSGLSQEP